MRLPWDTDAGGLKNSIKYATREAVINLQGNIRYAQKNPTSNGVHIMAIILGLAQK